MTPPKKPRKKRQITVTYSCDATTHAYVIRRAKDDFAGNKSAHFRSMVALDKASTTTMDDIAAHWQGINDVLLRSGRKFESPRASGTMRSVTFLVPELKLGVIARTAFVPGGPEKMLIQIATFALAAGSCEEAAIVLPNDAHVDDIAGYEGVAQNLSSAGKVSVLKLSELEARLGERT